MSNRLLGAKAPILLTIGVVLAIVLLVKPWNTGRKDEAKAPTASRSASSVSPPPQTTEQPTGGQQQAPIGEFVFLFDVSGSTHSGTSNPFLQGVNILLPSIDALRNLGELTPQRHRVATIGTTSLGQLPVCDVTIPHETLFKPLDKGRISRELQACDARLRSLPLEPYTDIRGGLAFAALSLRGQRPALRGIILVSDLDEDVAPNQVSATPDLRGMCVEVFTLVTSAGAKHPEILTANENSWRKHIQEWGAKSVQVQSVLGFDQQELVDFIRSCERK